MTKPKIKPPDHQAPLGELRVLRKLSNYEFAVELWVMRDGINENNWDYRNLDKNYLTFLGTPILCAYVGGKVGDGHNMREKRDPKTGEVYQSFTDGTAERIVGTLSDDEKDLSLVQKDGYTWIVAKGRLWSFYAPELVEKIVRMGRMAVSAETNVKSGTKDGEIEIYTEWEGLGVTILGENVPPAIPGARIAALAAMQEEFRELKLRAASLAPKNKPKNKITSREGVKQPMNKRDIARLAPKFEGYRIVGLSEDRSRVALVDKTGAPYTYTFQEEDKGEVIQSKLKPANLSVVYAFDGEDADLAVDLTDILEFAVNAAKTQDETVEKLTQDLEAANTTIAALQAQEHQRRVQSVKDMVAATLAEIADAAEEDDEGMEEEAEAVETNAESYASMEKNGAFCGDKQARADLMAACGEKRVKKAKAAAAAKKSSFAWDNFGRKEGGGDDGGIEAMLSRINH